MTGAPAEALPAPPFTSLLVATTNANKVREIRPLLAHLPLQLLTLADLPAVTIPPEETASTFWENARLKAFGYAAATGHVVVAEDSGLEIAALAGAPGVHSARFLGHEVSYPARFTEIFRRMNALGPVVDRSARFVTALVVARGRDVLFETESWIDGEITTPAGEHGFGYDPIFRYRPFGKTTAELTIEEKSAVSHRARAFRDFARWYEQFVD